jgi:hypothetical protein
MLACRPLIQLLRSFEHKDHLCLVFPLCSLSLFEVMQANSHQTLGLDDIEAIAKQCLEGLACECCTMLLGLNVVNRHAPLLAYFAHD